MTDKKPPAKNIINNEIVSAPVANGVRIKRRFLLSNTAGELLAFIREHFHLQSLVNYQVLRVYPILEIKNHMIRVKLSDLEMKNNTAIIIRKVNS